MPLNMANNPLQRITATRAILANLRLFEAFSKYLPVPVTVDVKGFRLRVGSPLRQRLYRIIIWLMKIKTLYAIATLAATSGGSHRSEIKTSIHFISAIGLLIATFVNKSFFDAELTAFVAVLNAILDQRHLLSKWSLQHVFLMAFPVSVVLTAIMIIIVFSVDPTWTIQFRYGAYWLNKTGLLSGWMYWALSGALASLDALMYFQSAVFVCYTQAEQILFFEVFIAAARDCVTWSDPIEASKQLAFLRLFLRYFNVANSRSIYLVKIICISTSVAGWTSILLGLVKAPLIIALMAGMSLMSSTAYPMVYYKAYDVSLQLQRAKRELLQRSLLIPQANSRVFVRKQLMALPNDGVWSGSFSKFERESVLIFWDFVVNQVVSMAIASG